MIPRVRRALVLAAIVLGGAAVAVALLASIGWPARAYWHGDHVVFWAGARAVLEGESPYDVAWWETLAEREGRPPLALPYYPPGGDAVTTSYPLWTFLAFLPFGALPYEIAAAAWLVVQAMLVTLALAAVASRLLPERRDRAVLAGLGLGYQPTWILAGNGNMTGFLLAALTAAFVALVSRRPYVAGACVGALLLKPHPFLLVPLIVLLATERPARFLAGAATVALTLAGVSLLVRPGWVGEWLAQVAAARSADLSTATAWGIGRVIDLPFAPAVLAAAAVAAFALWWRTARPAVDARYANGIAVSVAVAPYGWSYDHLHLLIAAAAVLRRLRAPSTRSAGLIALAATLGPLPWLLYAAALARGSEELSVVVPVACAVLLAITDRAARSGRVPGV